MPLLSIPHLVIAFQALAALFAFFALAGLGLAGVVHTSIVVSNRPATAGATRHSDVVIILLGGITWLLGSLALFVGSIGRLVTQVLAIAGAISLVLAVSLALTAHGLGAETSWARFGATVLTTLFLGVGLTATLLLRRTPRFLGVVATVACLFAYHTLWVGYPG